MNRRLQPAPTNDEKRGIEVRIKYSPVQFMSAEQAVRATQALLRAVDLCGGYRGLAEALAETTGIQLSPQAIFRWAAVGVPAERAVAIERALDGQVLRQELRPDLYEGMREV